MQDEAKEKITKIANDVIKILGPYFEEKVYEEAFVHELRRQNIRYDRQKNIEIIYKDACIGVRRPDCILYLPCKDGEEEILLEMKSVSKIEDKHKKQVAVYLASTKIKRGMILNFNKKGGIEIEEVTLKEKQKNKSNPAQPNKSKNLKDSLLTCAQNVLNELGHEFFYYDKGEEIYIQAISVELNKLDYKFTSASYPIFYKGQEIGQFTYEYLFENGDAVKFLSYKKEEEIKEKIEELKTCNKLLKINKAYLLAIPKSEELQIIVEEIKQDK